MAATAGYIAASKAAMNPKDDWKKDFDKITKNADRKSKVGRSLLQKNRDLNSWGKGKRFAKYFTGQPKKRSK